MRTKGKKGGFLAKYHAKLQGKLRGKAGPFLYRGQEQSSWRPCSSAARRIYNSKIVRRNQEIDLEMLIDYHKKDLLEPARLRGWHRESDGHELKDLELLAKLQHHGAATCLLDFTTRFDIALWFACRDADAKKKKKGKVFIADTSPDSPFVMMKVGLQELEADIGALLHFETRPTKQPRKKWKYWYWHPETLMGRMLSQESRFLFGPRNPNQKLLSIEIEEEDKAPLLEELEQRQGLNRETIFPDTQGFASANTHMTDLQKGHFDFYRGVAQISSEQYDKAIEIFNGVVELKPDDADAWLYRSKAKVQQEDYKGAVEDSSEAIRLKPDNAESWFVRGIVKGNLGQYEAAIQNLDEAIKLKPNYSAAWCHLGMAKSHLRRYEEAVKDFNKAIELDPTNSLAWGSRGLAGIYLEQYKESIKDSSQAIKLNRKKVSAWFNRSIARKFLEHYPKARSDLLKAKDLCKQEGNQEMQERIKTELHKISELEKSKSKPPKA